MQGMNATNESSAITLLIAGILPNELRVDGSGNRAQSLSAFRDCGGYRFGRSLETLFLEDAGRLHHWISS